jgi:RNA polymerase sigma-70 factor (ECF subfamily)
MPTSIAEHAPDRAIAHVGGPDVVIYADSQMHRAASHPRERVGDAPQDWVAALRGSTAVREEAAGELHALLLRGAHFELHRRHQSLSHLSYGELDDLAVQAADDALVAILAKLDSFRGASRFTTWAYKFVLLEAGVKARRRAWHGREVALEDDAWPGLRDTGPSAQQLVEDAETLIAIREAVHSVLTPHQREVFSALALNGVPIDVLAERLTTTRGALYKTLHDARRKLRAALADAGLVLDTTAAAGGGNEH